MELRSQKVRELAPEMDPLRMGMGWNRSSLRVLMETAIRVQAI